MVTYDWFAPIARSLTGRGIRYPFDRGVAFEENLNENTLGLLDKTLGEWHELEHRQEVPYILYSPVVLGNGRFLTVSSHPLSFLYDSTYFPLPDVIDIHDVVGTEQALRIRELSAIRANASFPIIMPTMALPTRPPLSLTDAGVRDNFGIEMALKVLYVHRQWINRHTSGVVLVLIRDLPLNINFLEEVPLLAPGMFFSVMAIQNHRQKLLLEMADRWFRGRLKPIFFVYERPWEKRASLSWHLTPREKADIIQQAYQTSFMLAYQRLRESLVGK